VALLVHSSSAFGRLGTLGIGGTALDVAAAFVGGLHLGWAPNYILLPFLAALLLISAVKVWRHQ
jgi:hypothetical protein